MENSIFTFEKNLFGISCNLLEPFGYLLKPLEYKFHPFHFPKPKYSFKIQFSIKNQSRKTSPFFSILKILTKNCLKRTELRAIVQDNATHIHNLEEEIQ